MEKFLEEQERMLSSWIEEMQILLGRMESCSYDQPKADFVYKDTVKPAAIVNGMRSNIQFAEACLRSLRKRKQLFS